jgi:IMP dehydrogenase
MGSIGAMQQGSADRYFQESTTGNPNADKLVPEGIEGRVAYSGSLGDVVYQLIGGLRSGMGYVGAASLSQLAEKARFMRVTTAGREESHPHDVTITHEAPNYHQEVHGGYVRQRAQVSPESADYRGGGVCKTVA